jgi:hypothetical protein
VDSIAKLSITYFCLGPEDTIMVHRIQLASKRRFGLGSLRSAARIRRMCI